MIYLVKIPRINVNAQIMMNQGYKLQQRRPGFYRFLQYYAPVGRVQNLDRLYALSENGDILIITILFRIRKSRFNIIDGRL